MQKVFKIGQITIEMGKKPFLIAGPCVLDDYETAFQIAVFLKDLSSRLDIPFIYKASYDKANRSSINAFRGPGVKQGLEWLGQIKSTLKIPIISDVHCFEEIAPASEVLDIIQIPAFLCRQTDFLVQVASTGLPVNIKKGQFLAPWDMKNVIEKLTSTNNHQIIITERGAAFGYNNLVVDFRGLAIMRDMGYPVIFDATHSVQLPGGQGTCSGGQRQFAPVLARAAVAAGVDGIFLEVYPEPDKAKCDGPNSLRLDELETLLHQLIAIHTILS